MHDYGSSFGEVLKAFRKKRQIRQQDLAKKLHVHYNTISKWERGICLPDSRGIVLEIAHCLRLDEQETNYLLEVSLHTVTSYWHVPHQRNIFFTGRQEHLDLLHQHFTAPDPGIAQIPYAITGLGGIGKSQLALEYAYAYSSHYHAIFWFEMETDEAMMASFAAIAEKLALEGRDFSDQQQLANAVLRWLSSRQDWLLICDNVIDLHKIQLFSPTLPPRGRLLLTTALQVTEPDFIPLPLECLTRTSGAHLLLRRTKRLSLASQNLEGVSQDEQDQAGKISDLLGGLPLALDQAGAYILETKCRLSDYPDLYEQHSSRLLARRSGEQTSHPASVTTTFSLLSHALEQRNQAALELLRACAFLAPETIPEKLFTRGGSALGPILGPQVGDAYLFNDILQDCMRYSLVQRDPQTQTLSLHRLVQTVLKESMDGATYHLWLRRVIEILALSGSCIDDDNMWSEYVQYVPHAMQVAPLIETLIETTQEAALVLSHIGKYLQDHAQFEKAEYFLKKAIQIGERQASPHWLAFQLEKLAELDRDRGFYKQAEHYYQRALSLQKTTSVPALKASLLNGLGLVYVQQSDYERAIPLYRESLRIHEELLHRKHPHIAHVLQNIGIVEQRQGRYRRAEQYYLQALSFREQMLDPGHPHIAFTLYNLGLLYAEQGELEKAKTFYQRCLLVRERTFQPDHPQLAYPIYGLAEICRGLQEYAEAETLYTRSLAIWERALGPMHHHVAYPWLGLGGLYKEQGRYVEAEQAYQRSLRIWDHSVGLDHADTVTVWSDFADLFYKQGRINQAEQTYRRSLQICQQKNLTDTLKAANPLKGLGDVYSALGEIAQARTYYQQALTLYEKDLGHKHQEAINVLHAIEKLPNL